jgi:hypothetical protein
MAGVTPSIGIVIMQQKKPDLKFEIRLRSRYFSELNPVVQGATQLIQAFSATFLAIATRRG